MMYLDKLCILSCRDQD